MDVPNCVRSAPELDIEAQLRVLPLDLLDDHLLGLLSRHIAADGSSDVLSLVVVEVDLLLAPLAGLDLLQVEDDRNTMSVEAMVFGECAECAGLFSSVSHLSDYMVVPEGRTDQRTSGAAQLVCIWGKLLFGGVRSGFFLLLDHLHQRPVASSSGLQTSHALRSSKDRTSTVPHTCLNLKLQPSGDSLEPEQINQLLIIQDKAALDSITHGRSSLMRPGCEPRCSPDP